MKCPACKQQLKEVQVGEVAIDHCSDGCNGIWFDRDELEKLDEPIEFLPNEVLVLEGGPAGANTTDVRQCPRCEEPLGRRYYDIQGEVEVDQCLKCSGIWLDTGEIATIRKQYLTEKERIIAADAWLNVRLADQKEDLWQDTAKKLGKSVQEAQSIANDGVISQSRLTKIVYGLLDIPAAMIDKVR